MNPAGSVATAQGAHACMLPRSPPLPTNARAAGSPQVYLLAPRRCLLAHASGLAVLQAGTIATGRLQRATAPTTTRAWRACVASGALVCAMRNSLAETRGPRLAQTPLPLARGLPCDRSVSPRRLREAQTPFPKRLDFSVAPLAVDGGKEGVHTGQVYAVCRAKPHHHV